MRYFDFRSKILSELQSNPDGLTWSELKQRLDLPYKKPCPTWIGQMEKDNGLKRVKGSGRAYLWKII